MPVEPSKTDLSLVRRRRTQRAKRAVLSALALACALACTREPDAPPHGIVLVGIDTLRASALSVYGNPRPTSPTIDDLAEQGVLFEQASSNASWTLPGFIGILTGSYPSRRTFRSRLRTSLVEALKHAGYRTAGFTEGAWVSRKFGFDLGFDTYWEERGKIVLAKKRSGQRQKAGKGGVTQTFARARNWLAEHGHEPFFLFLHTDEVHMPYRSRLFAEELPPGRIGPTYEEAVSGRVISGELPVDETEVEYVRALYDGSVRMVDEELKKILVEIEKLGVLDRTVIAVTSDHGEEMGERIPHWLARHGHALYEPVLRVPLIILDPRRHDAGKRIPHQVRTIDVMPTLLALAGIPIPDGTRGLSLVPLMDEEETTDRTAYSEMLAVRTGQLQRMALRVGNHKIIRNIDREEGTLPPVELYDLERDPLELSNLAEHLPDLRDELLERLQRERGVLGTEANDTLEVPDEVSPELRARLESLGYLEQP